ncbi:MAG: stage II sporulation protein R [Clostridia bacterium]|nr:stage II sporulation protein R [Clostridia bacterium]
MNKKVIKRVLLSVFLFVLALAGICEAVSDNISNEIVRLHIIANSDDIDDQNVKLLVRDEILRVTENEWGDKMSLSYAEENKEKLKKIADDVLFKNGFDYKSEIVTGNFFFPTKKYENITLPAGEYNAVRVILGDGKGQNWWCVLYPPLCFSKSAVGEISDADKERLSQMMNDFEYEMISDENIKLKPALKAVEIWENIKQKFNW